MSDVRLVATNPEDNTLVPVASNASGQLAVQSPKIEKVPNDLDVDGDLTVSGGGKFAGTVDVGDIFNASGGIRNNADGTMFISPLSSFPDTLEAFSLFTDRSINTDKSVVFTKAGSATFSGALTVSGGGKFAGDINVGDRDPSSTTNVGTRIALDGVVAGVYTQSLPSVDPRANAFQALRGNNEVFKVAYNGDATFSGDVVVYSRSKQWMLVEQGGLCHMVEQKTAVKADLVDPAAAATEYPKLRDVFAELNVIEKALEEVMEKLRMTEPDGWPVWDGSDNS